MVQCVRSDHSLYLYDQRTQVPIYEAQKRNLPHVCMSTTHIELDIQDNVEEAQEILEHCSKTLGFKSEKKMHGSLGIRYIYFYKDHSLGSSCYFTLTFHSLYSTLPCASNAHISTLSSASTFSSMFLTLINPSFHSGHILSLKIYGNHKGYTCISPNSQATVSDHIPQSFLLQDNE